MLSLIVAMDSNNAIGKENKLLCRLSDDLRLFKTITTGNIVVMGRKTLESIGKPLPNRTNVVLTRGSQEEIESKYDVVAMTKESVLEFSKKFPMNEIFIIGGGEIYKQFLPHASRLYLTKIHHKFDGADSFFPKMNPVDWEIIGEKFYFQNENNEYNFTFRILERVR